MYVRNIALHDVIYFLLSKARSCGKNIMRNLYRIHANVHYRIVRVRYNILEQVPATCSIRLGDSVKTELLPVLRNK